MESTQQQQTRAKEVDDDEAARSLAGDYMWGFQTASANEGRETGLAIAKGWGTDHEIRRFTTHSLLRGVEEWDQMLSCAAAMRERERDTPAADPLQGQDLLTYLSRLVLPHTVSQWVAEHDALLEEDATRKKPRKEKKKKGIKRKRKEMENNDSPYFAELPSQPDPQPEPQAQADVRAQLPPTPSLQQPLPTAESPQQSISADKNGLSRSQRRKLNKLHRRLEAQGPALQASSTWYPNDGQVAAPRQSQGDDVHMSAGHPPEAGSDDALKVIHS